MIENLTVFYRNQADLFGGIENKMFFCWAIIFVSARETRISGRETYVSGREMYVLGRRTTKLAKKINFCKAVRKQKQGREKTKVVK